MVRPININDILEEIHDYCIDIENREIYLHSHSLHTDDDPGVEFKMANRFIKNLFWLDKNPGTINIHLNSIGGDFYSGLMIYDVVQTSRSHINMICHGEVASIGTVILQAADVRISMPNCNFMLHFGSGSAGDENYINAQSYQESHNKLVSTMLNIYAEKCKNGVFFKGKTKNQIKSFLRNKFKTKGDWYINAVEAQHYGFIDKIVGVDCELKNL